MSVLSPFIRSFVDEMEKIAVQLNKDEQRRQSAYFAGLGAVSGPAIGAVSNLIQHGRPGPASGVPLKRWIPATMVGGALVSGALPSVRKMIEGRMKDHAKARLEAGT